MKYETVSAYFDRTVQLFDCGGGSYYGLLKSVSNPISLLKDVVQLVVDDGELFIVNVASITAIGISK
jgi:hypothetical protein